MDKETLIKKLDELDINPSMYSFTSDTNPMCYSIIGFANKWPVVYTEHNGEKEVLATFDSPEEAYDYMYNYFYKLATRFKDKILPKWLSESVKKNFPDQWEDYVKLYKGVEE